MSLLELAMLLEISPPSARYSVERSGHIASVVLGMYLKLMKYYDLDKDILEVERRVGFSNSSNSRTSRKNHNRELVIAFL